MWYTARPHCLAGGCIPTAPTTGLVSRRQWPRTTFPAQAFISCPASLSDPRGAQVEVPSHVPRLAPRPPGLVLASCSGHSPEGLGFAEWTGVPRPGGVAWPWIRCPIGHKARHTLQPARADMGLKHVACLPGKRSPGGPCMGRGRGKDGLPWPLWPYFKTLLHLHLPILPWRG